MIKTFEYDLLQCEERTWHSWENFTETITKNFQNFRIQNPDEQVKIKFNYTCEGTVILIDNKIFYQRLHEFGKKVADAVESNPATYQVRSCRSYSG